ncbi:hypothetical protein Esti_001952 [Eimeria stiedai]
MSECPRSFLDSIPSPIPPAAPGSLGYVVTKEHVEEMRRMEKMCQQAEDILRQNYKPVFLPVDQFLSEEINCELINVDIRSYPWKNTPFGDVYYSPRYNDDRYTYRHVILTNGVRKEAERVSATVPGGLLTQEVFVHYLGIVLSNGWSHFMLFNKQLKELILRRPKETDASTGPQTEAVRVPDGAPGPNDEVDSDSGDDEEQRAAIAAIRLKESADTPQHHQQQQQQQQVAEAAEQEQQQQEQEQQHPAATQLAAPSCASAKSNQPSAARLYLAGSHPKKGEPLEAWSNGLSPDKENLPQSTDPPTAAAAATVAAASTATAASEQKDASHSSSAGLEAPAAAKCRGRGQAAAARRGPPPAASRAASGPSPQSSNGNPPVTLAKALPASRWRRGGSRTVKQSALGGVAPPQRRGKMTGNEAPRGTRAAAAAATAAGAPEAGEAAAAAPAPAPAFGRESSASAPSRQEAAAQAASARSNEINAPAASAPAAAADGEGRVRAAAKGSGVSTRGQPKAAGAGPPRAAAGKTSSRAPLVKGAPQQVAALSTGKRRLEAAVGGGPSAQGRPRRKQRCV